MNGHSHGATVYKAINAVQGALAKEGITKDRKNQQQGYSFRGIDDVYNALSPLLAEHGLCILPRILSRTMSERETQKGGVLFSVVVEAEFDFVAVADGSKHTVRTYGEAMDSADKATNKAMSAAYKYACFMAFSVPTQADNDADNNTPDVKAKQKSPAIPATPPAPKVDAITDDQRRELRDAALAVFGSGYVKEMKRLMKSVAGVEDSLHLDQSGFVLVRTAIQVYADQQAVRTQ